VNILPDAPASPPASPQAAPGGGLPVEYFDGRQARPQAGRLWRVGAQAVLRTAQGEHRWPWKDIDWPERTRHGTRTAHLPEGGSLHSAEAATWDAWMRHHQVHDSWVVRAQQSWRATLVAVVLLIAVGAGMYQWGLPWASQGVLHLVPLSVDQQIGASALDSMDGQLLRPSELPAETRERITRTFEQAARRYHQAHPPPGGTPREVRVHFRASRIGPNAFALPDGSLVMTDELVELLKDREDVIVGVLGHELGHVEARHGMRTLVQSTLLGAITSLALGDVSGLIATAPALLGHLHYSRQMEREADDTAIRFLQANGMRPSIMVTLFERLREDGHDKPPSGERSRPTAKPPQDGDEGLGIALSSHPADEERMARFRQADQAAAP